MYRYVSNASTISAMTTINPRLNKRMSIDVVVYDTNEGPVPHVHVFLDKTRNPKNCSVVRLDKAEYSTHHSGKLTTMNKKQKREFIDIMKSEWNDRRGKSTGYERAVDIWVDAFEDGSYEKFVMDENGVPVMPDYSVL